MRRADWTPHDGRCTCSAPIAAGELVCADCARELERIRCELEDCTHTRQRRGRCCDCGRVCVDFRELERSWDEIVSQTPPGFCAVCGQAVCPSWCPAAGDPRARRGGS